MQDFQLVLRCGSSNLNQEFLQIRAGQCGVGCTFVANRADGSQVGRVIGAAHAFVDDVSQMQARFSGGVIRVCLSRHGAAHLASETIAIQHKGSGFFGDSSGKSWLGLWRFQKVLTGFEFTSVVVRQDLVTLFGSQFTNSSRPFGLILGDNAQFVGVHDPTDVVQEMRSQLGFGSTFDFGIIAHGQARLSLVLAAAWSAN